LEKTKGNSSPGCEKFVFERIGLCREKRIGRKVHWSPRGGENNRKKKGRRPCTGTETSIRRSEADLRRGLKKDIEVRGVQRKGGKKAVEAHIWGAHGILYSLY